MRSLLLVTTAFAGIATALPALAQTDDMWSGFYIGANAGVAWGKTSTSINGNPGGGVIVIPPAELAALNAIPAQSSNNGGFAGGIEAGYNWKIDDWLLGIETDYGAFDVGQTKNQSITSPVLISPAIVDTINQHLKTDWMWTLRPRLGYASGPWLGYVTGGIATTNIKYSASFFDTRVPQNAGSQEISDTKTGWTLGFGGAYALDANWSIKAEYLYADFGNVRGTFTTPTGFVNFTSEAKVIANVLRAGVDYRF
jgi:outer membrane immunogenic protein